MFIADLNNHRVRKVDTGTSHITTLAGDGTPRCFILMESLLRQLRIKRAHSGVAVDNSGSLYIADFQNNRIRKVHGCGIITTVAGNGHFWFLWRWWFGNRRLSI